MIYNLSIFSVYFPFFIVLCLIFDLADIRDRIRKLQYFFFFFCLLGEFIIFQDNLATEFKEILISKILLSFFCMLFIISAS